MAGADTRAEKRGLEMKEVVPRELCRSGNREYILKKLQKPHSTGGLYVADGELWDAIKDVLDYLAALPKKVSSSTIAAL
jgi:hypothetical protein